MRLMKPLCVMRDDDAFVGDQVFDGDLAFVGHDFASGAAWRIFP